jgi:hypothetical protein
LQRTGKRQKSNRFFPNSFGANYFVYFVNDMRVSIKKHNQQYLQRLAAQMEVDPSEAVNYLLTELRRVGYSFNSNVTLALGNSNPSRSTENQEQGHSFVMEVKAKELGSTGSLMNALSKDPVIERILTAGLEVF